MDKTPVNVVVVGSANVDMVAVGERIPSPGESLFADRFFTVPGGKGANQAVAAARLGAKVIFIACVGNDSFGDGAIAGYQQDGIDTSHIVQHPTAHTGIALINVDAEGRNAILVAPGANAEFSVEMVDKCEDIIASADIVVCQLEIPMPVVQRCCELAHKHQRKLLLNPAPVKPIHNELLSLASVITPNEFELLQLLELPADTDESLAAKQMRNQTGAAIVVTLGKRGVMLCDSDQPAVLPGFVVKAADSTGAGDCFSGALAVKLAEGCPLCEAIPYAQAAAALSVTRMGAQASMPTREEVDNFLATQTGNCI